MGVRGPRTKLGSLAGGRACRAGPANVLCCSRMVEGVLLVLLCRSTCDVTRDGKSGLALQLSQTKCSRRGGPTPCTTGGRTWLHCCVSCGHVPWLFGVVAHACLLTIPTCTQYDQRAGAFVLCLRTNLFVWQSAQFFFQRFSPHMDVLGFALLVTPLFLAAGMGVAFCVTVLGSWRCGDRVTVDGLVEAGGAGWWLVRNVDRTPPVWPPSRCKLYASCCRSTCGP